MKNKKTFFSVFIKITVFGKMFFKNNNNNKKTYLDKLKIIYSFVLYRHHTFNLYINTIPLKSY